MRASGATHAPRLPAEAPQHLGGMRGSSGLLGAGPTAGGRWKGSGPGGLEGDPCLLGGGRCRCRGPAGAARDADVPRQEDGPVADSKELVSPEKPPRMFPSWDPHSAGSQCDSDAGLEKEQLPWRCL